MPSSYEIRFTRALESFEYEGAFRCLYRSYCRRGLARPNATRPLRLTRHHLLPETRVFVALAGRRVIGTLSLIEDRPLGVPMRLIFGRHIDDLASADPRITEAGCLAVDETRGDGLVVVHHLMGLAAQAAARRGMTRVLIAVHPRHASFYERAAGFKRFTPMRPHPSVQGSPAVGLELNLATLHVDTPHAWRRYFGMSFSPLALTTRPTPTRSLQRLSNLWQRLHEEEAAPQERFESRRRALIVQAEGAGRNESQLKVLQPTRLCG